MGSPLTELLRAVQAHLGLTQRQLAPWLGVSYRTVAYAARGARPLPTAALLQLTQLARLLPANGGAAADPAPPDPAALRRRLADCRFELTRLQRELADAEARATAATNLRAAAAALLPDAPPAGRLWLELQQAEAARTLGTYGLTAQALRRARVAALEAEITWLTQALGEGA